MNMEAFWNKLEISEIILSIYGGIKKSTKAKMHFTKP